MSEHVTIDTPKPVCLGVHYNTSVVHAKEHFESEGFRGMSTVGTLDGLETYDCNEARRRALDAARRGQGLCYWRGDWDYSAGRCKIYVFTYTSYDGPKIDGDSDEVKLHANWSGH